MHAWIFQLSNAPIEETINENTLYQGEGTDYDYCAAISTDERKEAIKTLVKDIFPTGMFGQIDHETIEYLGGMDEWKQEWVHRIQHKASQISSKNVMEFVGATYKLQQIIQNPLDTDSHFYL